MRWKPQLGRRPSLHSLSEGMSGTAACVVARRMVLRLVDLKCTEKYITSRHSCQPILRIQAHYPAGVVYLAGDDPFPSILVLQMLWDYPCVSSYSICYSTWFAILFLKIGVEAGCNTNELVHIPKTNPKLVWRPLVNPKEYQATTEVASDVQPCIPRVWHGYVLCHLLSILLFLVFSFFNDIDATVRSAWNFVYK